MGLFGNNYLNRLTSLALDIKSLGRNVVDTLTIKSEVLHRSIYLCLNRRNA